MAPRYLAATNLFVNGQNEDNYINIINILRGQVIDDETTPINQSIDDKLIEMARQPARVTRTDTSISFCSVVGVVCIMVAVGIVSLRCGMSGGGETDKNIVEDIKDSSSKTITIEGNWDIKIVDDKHITLCNKENKCYPILLKEGEIEKVKAFLENPERKEQFRVFRDTYLRLFPNVEVFSVDGANIKWDLWNEHFLEYYYQVIVYIDNRN